MPEAAIFDTRHLSEGDREVYSGPRRIILAPNLIGGWVPYCLTHDLGLRLATRDEARKGRDTGTWCYGCIEEAKRPEPDLTALRFAQSQECGCMRAWPSIRLAWEGGALVPRCEGCGAVPSFLHWVTAQTGIDKGGDTGYLFCSCGHKSDWESEAENHCVDANKAIRFQHVGYGRYTRG